MTSESTQTLNPVTVVAAAASGMRVSLGSFSASQLTIAAAQFTNDIANTVTSIWNEMADLHESRDPDTAWPRYTPKEALDGAFTLRFADIVPTANAGALRRTFGDDQYPELLVISDHLLKEHIKRITHLQGIRGYDVDGDNDTEQPPPEPPDAPPDVSPGGIYLGDPFQIPPDAN